MKTGFLALLILAVSPAHAYDLQPYVNTEMQKVEANSQAQDMRGSMIVQPPGQINSADVHLSSPVPMNNQDSIIRNVEPLNSKEQIGADLDSPRSGYRRAVDPALEIQNEIAEKDAKAKQRKNYRNAVKREFERRALEDGVIVDRNIAEEIKQLETRVSH